MRDFLRKWKKTKNFKMYITEPNGNGTFEILDYSPFHEKVQIQPIINGRGLIQTNSIEEWEIESIDIHLK